MGRLSTTECTYLPTYLHGLPGSCASTSTYGWPWLASAGLGGAGWLLE